MSDSYFDAARAAGTYPRKGYGYLTEEEKRTEIQRKINKGWEDEWVLKEAKRMGISKQDKRRDRENRKEIQQTTGYSRIGRNNV
jgi:hypothetical protein